MTSLSFTSGEIFDIISALEDKAEIAEESGKFHLSEYYHKIIDQFDSISDKLNKMTPEERIATLVLAA
jgi:hypothetical protein